MRLGIICLHCPSAIGVSIVHLLLRVRCPSVDARLDIPIDRSASTHSQYIALPNMILEASKRRGDVGGQKTYNAARFKGGSIVFTPF